METKKLKGKNYIEIGINKCAASDFCSNKSDPTYSPSKIKKKIMTLQGKKKLVPETPKCLKSKNKKVWSDHSKKSRSIARKRTRYSDIYDDVEAKFSVMERAERVLSLLENGLPYFVKCMLPSNVAHGFWLHLPKKFCSLHFPSHDSTILLVDEWGNEYKTSYLLERHGLSAGWRGFSISHRLLKGDILIFHLTEPCKLKVHIVRVNGSEVMGAALCLMNLDASGRGTDSGWFFSVFFASSFSCLFGMARIYKSFLLFQFVGMLYLKEDVVKNNKRKRKKMKYVEPFLVDISARLENGKGKITPNSNLGPVAYQSESNSQGYSSVVTAGSEINNQLHSNDLFYSKKLLLHDHPREVATS